MNPVLEQEAADLRRALEKKSRHVTVSLSYDTAEFISSVIDAKIEGRGVLFTNESQELTPTEAALFLGMSRPQVRKIMDSGRLPFRMVGTHHRIAASNLVAFKEAEQARRKEVMKEYAELQNELGVLE